MANNTKRNKPIEQDPKIRSGNFNEVSLGFNDILALNEAERCLNCKNPKCVEGCPVGVKIPQFIQCVKNNDLEGAVKIIKQDNNLPAVCGRVCPQEEQCEKLCIRNNERLGGSVAIGALERFVADYSLKNPSKAILSIEKINYKVAVIGSGPSGLTCAADLALAGIKVTIFEAFHKAGGVLVYGIPEFRLPKELVKKEIDNLLELGVEIRLNTVIGKTITVEELQQEYDAIFIGSGAGLPQFLNLKGENLNGVYSANEFLTRVNLMKAYDKNSITPVKIGKKVAVIGAGNVAMDSARTALRLGAEEVYIVYRRGRDEMPAREEEIHHAEEEGIKFLLLTNPIEIMGEKIVSGLKCVKMELGEPDKSGRRKPIEIKDSQFDIICDMVIMALGTSPNPLIRKSCNELKFNDKGTIIINEETNETSINNIYAGGDAVTGAATVILAMGAGKKAAKSIIEKLKNKTK